MGPRAGSKILVIEDEPTLAEAVRHNLEREGLTVAVVSDGKGALLEFKRSQPALVLLDLMLPEISGLDLCKLIRAESNVPIIMLTAKDAESDKVAGLELGADDYITKPFSMRELISRVRAQLRRAKMAPLDRSGDSDAPPLSAGAIRLDPDRHVVSVNGAVMPMTPKEFAVLELLLDRKGRLLTREFLMDEIWGPSYVGETKTLDVHIKRIREKIEADPRNPKHLLTVRGLGYKFVDKDLSP